MKIKRKVHNILPVMVFGSETWLLEEGLTCNFTFTLFSIRVVLTFCPAGFRCKTISRIA